MLYKLELSIASASKVMAPRKNATHFCRTSDILIAPTVFHPYADSNQNGKSNPVLNQNSMDP
jgi:hypothetical protein